MIITLLFLVLVALVGFWIVGHTSGIVNKVLSIGFAVLLLL